MLERELAAPSLRSRTSPEIRGKLSGTTVPSSAPKLPTTGHKPQCWGTQTQQLVAPIPPAHRTDRLIFSTALRGRPCFWACCTGPGCRAARQRPLRRATSHIAGKRRRRNLWLSHRRSKPPDWPFLRALRPFNSRLSDRRTALSQCRLHRIPAGGSRCVLQFWTPIISGARDCPGSRTGFAPLPSRCPTERH